MKVSFHVFESRMKSWTDLCGKLRRSPLRRGRNSSSTYRCQPIPGGASSSSGTGNDAGIGSIGSDSFEAQPSRGVHPQTSAR
jgi:hypothetical protein